MGAQTPGDFEVRSLQRSSQEGRAALDRSLYFPSFLKVQGPRFASFCCLSARLAGVDLRSMCSQLAARSLRELDAPSQRLEPLFFFSEILALAASGSRADARIL